MALGNQIAEFKGKTTTRTVLETGGNPIRAQFNNEGTISGKISGMLMYTITLAQHADGTGKADCKIAIMGPEGEMASGGCTALGCPAAGGKFTIRGLLWLHSDNPKWAWLNTTPLALESTADMQTSEEIGRLYEWK
jgi:hypothetical protein